VHFLGYVILACGLAAGNYVFQFGQAVPDWGKAFERSFFGAEGVLMAYLCVKFVQWGNKNEKRGPEDHLEL